MDRQKEGRVMQFNKLYVQVECSAPNVGLEQAEGVINAQNEMPK
jgi:hypothetical protein